MKIFQVKKYDHGNKMALAVLEKVYITMLWGKRGFSVSWGKIVYG